MPRLCNWRWHAILAVLWTVIGGPLSLYWRQSLLWVSFMSLYAIVITHAGADQADQAKRAAQDLPTERPLAKSEDA